MDAKAHWENVYSTKAADEVSWFQATPALSLEILDSLPLGQHASVIDVGGGDSRFVDALIDRHIGSVTVVDISANAIRRAQTRLGRQSPLVHWVEGDVTTVELPHAAFDVWHDRAVFHFLTLEADRERYVATALASIRNGGHAIVATFATDGPTRCSGLDVVRYSPESLAATFGPGFEMVHGVVSDHVTPWKAVQRFSVAVLRRAG